MLSTHLIDEVSNLLEHVIVIDQGRILIDQRRRDAARLGDDHRRPARRGRRPSSPGRDVIHREGIGGLASVTIDGGSASAERAQRRRSGLELAPVSLQQLIIHLTGGDLAGSTEQEAAA